MLIYYLIDVGSAPAGDQAAQAAVERTLIHLASICQPSLVKVKARLFALDDDCMVLPLTTGVAEDHFEPWSVELSRALTIAWTSASAALPQSTITDLTLGEWAQQQIHGEFAQLGNASIASDGAVVILVTRAEEDREYSARLAEHLGILPSAFAFHLDVIWLDTSALFSTNRFNDRDLSKLRTLLRRSNAGYTRSDVLFQGLDARVGSKPGDLHVSGNSKGKEGVSKGKEVTSKGKDSINAGQVRPQAQRNEAHIGLAKRGRAQLVSLEQVLFFRSSGIPISVLASENSHAHSAIQILDDSAFDLKVATQMPVADTLPSTLAAGFAFIIVADSLPAQALLETCRHSRNALVVSRPDGKHIALISIAHGLAVGYVLEGTIPSLKATSEQYPPVTEPSAMRESLEVTVGGSGNTIPHSDVEVPCSSSECDVSRFPAQAVSVRVTVCESAWVNTDDGAYAVHSMKSLVDPRPDCQVVSPRSRALEQCRSVLHRINERSRLEQASLVTQMSIAGDITLSGPEEASLREQFKGESDESVATAAKLDFLAHISATDSSDEALLVSALRLRSLVRLVRSPAVRAQVRADLAKELDSDPTTVARGMVAHLALASLDNGSDETEVLKKRLSHSLSLVSISWRDPHRFANFLRVVLRPLSPANLWSWLRKRFLDEEDSEERTGESPGGHQLQVVRWRKRIAPPPPVPAFHLATPLAIRTAAASHTPSVRSKAAVTPLTHIAAGAELSRTSAAVTEALPTLPLVAGQAAQRRKRVVLNHFTETLSDPQQLRKVIVIGNASQARQGPRRARLSLPIALSESPRGFVDATPTTVQRPVARFQSGQHGSGASKQLFLTPLVKGTPLMAVKARNALASSVPSSAQSVAPRPSAPVVASKRRLVEMDAEDDLVDVQPKNPRLGVHVGMEPTREWNSRQVEVAQPRHSGLEDDQVEPHISELSRGSDNA